MEFLEQFWAKLLSGDPDQVRPAWESLSTEEKSAVRSQLGRMRSESGWHASQRASAESALETIDSFESSI
jgi:hypothetical protein